MSQSTRERRPEAPPTTKAYDPSGPALRFGVWGLMALGLATMLASTQVPLLGSDWAELLVATVTVLLLAGVGGAWSVSTRGRWDFFHPLVFPLLYIAVSFLLPIWVTFVSGHPVGSLSRNITVATNTPSLLCLGVLGFAAGAALPFRSRPRAARAEEERRSAATVLLQAGRGLTVVALGLSLLQLRQGGILARGLDQTTYTSADTLAVVLKVLPPTAALLLCAAAALRDSGRTLTRLDWLLVLMLIASIGVRGSRNTAIAIALVVLFTYTRQARKPKLITLAAGLAGAVGFMLLVLRYRNEVRGVSGTRTWWESILGDMAPVGFSTGVVASHVPAAAPYEHGATMVAAALRLLPGPLSVRLFGEPDDTGARVFRDLIQLNNPNAGVGFSLPADGYLNFGIVGLVLVCFLLGALMAWAYARVDLRSVTVRGMIYPLLVALMPFGLRSDLLGMSKAVLYPAVMLLVVVVVARTVSSSTRPRARPAKPVGPTARLRPGPGPSGG